MPLAAVESALAALLLRLQADAMKALLLTFALGLAAATAAHAQVSITVDTSLADRTLSLACSGQSVDDAAVRSSPVVQAQIHHNQHLRATATMDNYVAALRAASACQAPTPDPFRVGDVIAHRDTYRRKIEAIHARQAELANAVAQRLSPYMPAGASFTGSVVLAVPYFSCGGFSADSAFFIDVRCLDDDLDNDFAALTYLVTHETYHAIQSHYFFQAVDDPSKVHNTNDAVEFALAALLTEGSATYVAPPGELPDTPGPLTRLDREFALTNANRLRQNFLLMSMLINEAAHSHTPAQTAQDVYSIGFSGDAYQEMGYYVGARMAHDIEAAWGRPALVCVAQLPPEQFVLADDAATASDTHALRLSADAVAAARTLARHRRGRRFETCRH